MGRGEEGEQTDAIAHVVPTGPDGNELLEQKGKEKEEGATGR